MNDPLKLIPFLVYAGAIALKILHEIDANTMLMMLAGTGLVHSGISSLNNVNPPKDR